MDSDIVVSQIRATLKMLRSAIEACPKDLWIRESDHNQFWVLAYHTLFYTHLYLSASEDAFEPWDRKASGHAAYGRGNLGDWSELAPEDAFSKADVLAYCDHISENVSRWVGAAPFDVPSGFHWLKFSRGEAHLYNLRHIAHHAGQLIDRLRREDDLATTWVMDGR